MFVRNFNSLNLDKLVGVNSDVRKYLEDKGFCLVTKNKNKWYFTKTDELMRTIDLYEGGENNE